ETDGPPVQVPQQLGFGLALVKGEIVHRLGGEVETSFDQEGLRMRMSVARDRKSTRLNSSHVKMSYAVFCLKKKNKQIPISDFGNIICEGNDLENARKEQIQSVSELIQRNYFPVILGGGHETALGNFLALAENFDDIGIVNIDAHYFFFYPFDERPALHSFPTRRSSD